MARAPMTPKGAPLERARAKGRIVAVLGQVVARLVGQLELYLALFKALA